MISKYILLAILLSALVTWIPRVLPFILVKYKGLPPMAERFLKYLPVSIIFALILSSVTNAKTGQLPSFKWLDLLAIFHSGLWRDFSCSNTLSSSNDLITSKSFYLR